MKTVYIITSGCYSDYHIECCFSTREKAEEYLEVIKNNLYNDGIRLWNYSDYDIEEYIIDCKPEIVTVIRLWIESPELDKLCHPNVPFKDALLSEKVKINTEKELSHTAIESERIETQHHSNRLYICRIANPNKPLEEEKERIKKIAYDTINKVKYLVKVEGIKYDEINKYLK